LSLGAWTARRRDDTSSQQGVAVGLAAYLFASSLVDLHAFVNDVVGVAAQLVLHGGCPAAEASER
jgi:hypothetical protein